ncbi:hypothetical protein BVU17_05805 [Haloarcula taiwanensis]|uniref:Uncharacterized protein n=2 Tax=Haloarcula TaxID=2237 RepID=A0A2H4ZX72_9EURY|nr:hypothetical protein BVU17_05805 [Haloarcula taiwanensis]RLM42292.1 hypothetical protein DVK00_18030 [Haloarcula sp. Atlit-47R]RLM95651.1 hypothetical protein D3D01_13185 [Haloarcula sp. Atlit-7R]
MSILTNDRRIHMANPSDPLYAELEKALETAETEAARYHIRQALQIRIAEETAGKDILSA